MKRHYQVILEGIISVLIIIDLLFLGLVIIGFTVGIKSNSVYSVGIFDLIIAILILIDLILFRIRKEKNKWQYLRENWAYIIAIIPLTFICFNIFNLFSFIIFIGLIGIFRIYALLKVLLITGRYIRKYPSKTKLDYATFALLIILIFGSLLFMLVEKPVNPEVPNYESAIWFTIVSMTTTGYGDITPVTATGRIIAVMLILTGMGYLSLVTATLAYSFIDILRKERREATERLGKRVNRFEENFDRIERKLDEMEKKKPK